MQKISKIGWSLYCRVFGHDWRYKVRKVRALQTCSRCGRKSWRKLTPREQTVESS